MKNDTLDEIVVKYEKMEWSNSWWNNADDDLLPRVLLIGDSISCAYGPVLINLLEGRANVDRIANSRSITDPMLFGEILNGLKHSEYPVIHFNNGLHGWHISDADYRKYLMRYVKLLKTQAPKAKLIWATSTPITVVGNPSEIDKEKNARVVARNQISLEIMKKADVPVNDLYSLVIDRPEIRVDDGYHYNPDGAELMGKAVMKSIAQFL